MLFRKLLLVLFVGTMVVALPLYAQDDGEETLALLDGRGVLVRPLEDVTESDAQILDITANAARLHFVGTIPLACTIVFGPTTDFGLAAIDLNMNGGAIIEHNPLMLGLEPDTEYFYRLQGSAEDGTFYVSEIGSFRTLPPSDEAVDNLLSPAGGAQILGVSSNFGGQTNDGVWGIERALDNNPNTAWSSNSDGSEAWVEIELRQRSHITQIEFWTRFMSNGTAQIFEFTVTTDSGEVYGPFSLADPDQAYRFDVDFEASTLRFDVVDSNGGNTGAVEIAAYGEPVE
jgi:hypothetical protein